MIGIIIAVHVLVCVGLIVLVLVQRGRGGGLVESFSGIETMFGTKTSAFLTKSTTVLSVIFFITCLSLALLSVQRSKSLIDRDKNASATQPAVNQTQTEPQPAAQQPQTPTGTQPQAAAQE